MYRHPRTRAKKPHRGFANFLIPDRLLFFTTLLIYINIAVFVLMVATGAGVVSPDKEILLLWGANFKPLTAHGQWWRLITCCFVHGGIVHLLTNMVGLSFCGLMLEPFLLGRWKFIIAYILTGIAASVTSLCWHERTISVGASGAILGMYGLFLALLTTRLVDRETRKDWLMFTCFYVGYNLVRGAQPGIDNAAHIGGLISGLVLGYLFYPGLKKRRKVRRRYNKKRSPPERGPKNLSE